MSEHIGAIEAARLLAGTDRILLLIHQYPDGDTLGSAFALCRALTTLGKSVRVECADPIPQKYDYLMEGIPLSSFDPAFICAVDVADIQLLGSLASPYEDKIDLCIDHHGSNTQYARSLFLDPNAAATTMLIYEVIQALGVPLDSAMAESLYTGLATDTGCFRYANTTPSAHRMAAELLELGVRSDFINRTMFDIKSRERMELERLTLDSMRFYFDGRCAVMTVTNDMIRRSGAQENDMEGLAPIPRQIEGVWVGLTLRQKADGNFKVSVRTGTHANASAICAKLGGGGHKRAAGCSLEGPASAAVDKLLAVIQECVPAICRSN